MTRIAHMIGLAAFLALSFGAPVSFAGEPTPTEQKEKKDANSGKAEDDSKNKDEKRAWAASNPDSRERDALLRSLISPSRPIRLQTSYKLLLKRLD